MPSGGANLHLPSLQPKGSSPHLNPPLKKPDNAASSQEVCATNGNWNGIADHDETGRIQIPRQFTFRSKRSKVGSFKRSFSERKGVASHIVNGDRQFLEKRYALACALKFLAHFFVTAVLTRFAIFHSGCCAQIIPLPGEIRHFAQNEAVFEAQLHSRIGV